MSARASIAAAGRAGSCWRALESAALERGGGIGCCRASWRASSGVGGREQQWSRGQATGAMPHPAQCAAALPHRRAAAAACAVLPCCTPGASHSGPPVAACLWLLSPGYTPLKSGRPMYHALKTPALARGNPFGVLSAHMCVARRRAVLSFKVSVTTRRPSKDPISLTTTPALVHVPLGCIPPSPIVSHLPGPCMCVRGCVPLCLCLPIVEGGRVSLRVTHTRVWAMHNAIPGPSSAPLAPYPPCLTSSLPPTPPPLPLPLPPSLASSPPHSLGLPCCLPPPHVPLLVTVTLRAGS